MTIRLTIDREIWENHVETLIASTEHPVPVVKGNGYGLGRARLAGIAADLADTIAVGTVHELDDLPTGVRPVVLTPTLEEPPTADAVLTIIDPATATNVDLNDIRIVKQVSRVSRLVARAYCSLRARPAMTPKRRLSVSSSICILPPRARSSHVGCFGLDRRHDRRHGARARPRFRQGRQEDRGRPHAHCRR